MAYSLSDVFIGEFPQIQTYGTRPDAYNARYGIRGHNGIDWATPNLTPALATWDGTVLDTGFDTAAYGNFIKLHHGEYLTLYAHLNDVAVNKGDHVVCGQLIGHTGHTGVADHAGLHFAIAPTDAQGNKTLRENGYGGYINPMGSECYWQIKHLQAPVLPQAEVEQLASVAPKELSDSRSMAGNFSAIYKYLSLQHFGNTVSTIDPLDPEAGQKINAILKDHLIFPEQNSPTEDLPVERNKTILQTTKEEYAEYERTHPSQGIFQSVKKFVFKNAT